MASQKRKAPVSKDAPKELKSPKRMPKCPQVDFLGVLYPSNPANWLSEPWDTKDLPQPFRFNFDEKEEEFLLVQSLRLELSERYETPLEIISNNLEKLQSPEYVKKLELRLAYVTYLKSKNIILPADIDALELTRVAAREKMRDIGYMVLDDISYEDIKRLKLRKFFGYLSKKEIAVDAKTPLLEIWRLTSREQLRDQGIKVADAITVEELEYGFNLKYVR